MRFSEDWYSQAGQDQWITEFFNNKKKGYFLDIGAADGWGDSNTWYLEEKLDWTGICFEAGVVDYMKCKSLRKNSKVLPIAVWNEDTNLVFQIGSHSVSESGNFGVPVKAMKLSTVFEKYDVPTTIDYASLDIEGAELKALEGFPWETHKVICWTIEHNLYRGDRKHKEDIYEFMTSKGYVRVKEDVACKDSNWEPYEDWYVHKDFVK